MNFNIRFDQIEGLKAGDGIFFEGNTVGDVDKVAYTQKGDYLVDVTIHANFANAATRNSHFYITNDPQTDGKMAIEIIQDKPGGEILRDGETVSGEVRPTVLGEFLNQLQREVQRYQARHDDDFETFKNSLQQDSQQLERKMADTLDRLSREFSQFAEGIQQVPDSQELKKLRATLDQLAGEMRNSQRDLREKIRNELIPEIQKRLNLLREKLKQYNRQDEIDPLDRQLKEIQNT